MFVTCLLFLAGVGSALPMTIKVGLFDTDTCRAYQNHIGSCVAAHDTCASKGDQECLDVLADPPPGLTQCTCTDDVCGYDIFVDMSQEWIDMMCDAGLDCRPAGKHLGTWEGVGSNDCPLPCGRGGPCGRSVARPGASTPAPVTPRSKKNAPTSWASFLTSPAFTCTDITKLYSGTPQGQTKAEQQCKNQGCKWKVGRRGNGKCKDAGKKKKGPCKKLDEAGCTASKSCKPVYKKNIFVKCK